MRVRTNLSLLLLLASALTTSCGGETTTSKRARPESRAQRIGASDCIGESVDGRVTFCHATSSVTNPYTVITVSTNACLNGHVRHADDVPTDANGDCCPLDEQDCAGVCGGVAVEDCAGTCEGLAVEDCAGTCDGLAVVDCAGTCDGLAVIDCAGTCDGLAVVDCAGTCDGLAVVDCAGTCGGLAEDVDVVHFTTNDGVFRWTSGDPTASPSQISTFPSYALAVSPLGEVFVGTGGVEATAQGLGTAGIYAIDAAGLPTLLSSTAAEDLQFAPGGGLHAANSSGIYAIDSASGLATQVSTNPTSQFAFETATTVVTTNGLVYAATFARRTDRIDLSTGTTTLLNGDGGEDIKVDGGDILLCGQGGIFRVLASGAFTNVYNGRRVFNFGLNSLGDLYLGNSATYGTTVWPRGFYAPALSSVALSSADINALVVTETCE